MSISYEISGRRHWAYPIQLQTRTAWWQLAPVQCGFLIVWSLLLFVYGIHQGDLYRTEGLRAVLGAEMYRTGDWVIPRLYGESILTKPPMLYWAIALTGQLYGEVTVWATRLPAAFAGMLAVLVVWAVFRRYYSPSITLLAALALPCTGMWLEKASSAEIDTLLIFWVLAAWACFIRLMEVLSQKQSSYQQLFWWCAALLCVAGGVLTKWTGFLFFYAMAIPCLFWHRQFWRLFHWHHLLAALLGVAVVFSWLGLVINELGWSQVTSMLWKEGAPRVLHGQNASRTLVLETLAHPFLVLAICLPWPIFLVHAWRRKLYHRDAKVPVTMQVMIDRSLWCWALAGTLMMTFFPDHNIRQSFSLVPAWTLLGVLALCRLFQAAALPSWMQQKPLRALMLALAVWCVIKIVHVEVLIPARFAKRPSLDEQAFKLQQAIPITATLYISKLKDECLMFHYGREVIRLREWDGIIPTYCLLTAAECASWPTELASQIKHETPLLNAQCEPIFLVQLAR
ncbi:MAG: glycosyltransferase family 39 protein [Planctomycetia bacterium]|nr:glycosyltransferase family 39 protein [Planctomycetia bacterium]